MTDKPDGLLGRAYTALAACYALVWCLPAILAAVVNGSNPPGSTPGFTYGDSGRESCRGDFGCPSEPWNLAVVLAVTAAVLAPSLLVAVPLCIHLARRWRTPVLAGSVAAVTGWAALCAGGLLYLIA